MKRDIQTIFAELKAEANTQFVSRDLSWIEFNRRVLFQAKRGKEVPLKERMKFLGITSSNLDEFSMVRLAAVYHRGQTNRDEPEISGLLPFDEERELREEIEAIKEDMEFVFKELKEELEEEANVQFCKYRHLSQKERFKLNKVFMEQIFPKLTPFSYTRTNTFPIIKSKELNMAVVLNDKGVENPKDVLCFISLHGIDRLYTLEDGHRTKVVLLEEIVRNNLHKIFINKKIKTWGCFRLLRDAYFMKEDDPDKRITSIVSETLRSRWESKVMLMEHTRTLHATVVKLLARIFHVDRSYVSPVNTLLDYTFLMDFPDSDSIPAYEPYTADPSAVIHEDDNIFDILDEEDVILHHPYDSYDPVVRLIDSAADDEEVTNIRQTLYRVSSLNSPIVNALCRASENGKRVSVLVEVKARFDEEQNIRLTQKLIRSGVQVSNGVEGLKSHCKMLSIMKEGRDGVRYYSHVGTGNYNDKTARLYTDISYMTSSPIFGRDLVTVFNTISGYSMPEKEITSMVVSPQGIRDKLDKLIEKETKKGKNGAITIVLNSLSDKKMIEKLYRASDEGVDVNILCRGVCSMNTVRRIDGTVRENLNVKSVVGRYLEHSRIYKFGKGDKANIWIASADMLVRNLDHRVEIMTPIIAPNSKKKINDILDTMMGDTFNSFYLEGEFWYKRSTVIKNRNCHNKFMRRAV